MRYAVSVLEHVKFPAKLNPIMKGLFVFLVFLISFAVNVDDNSLARMGFERDYLMMGLAAMVLTGLVTHRHLLLIVLVFFVSIGANMPSEFMLNLGLDRDLFVVALGAIILSPLLVRLIK